MSFGSLVRTRSPPPTRSATWPSTTSAVFDRASRIPVRLASSGSSSGADTSGQPSTWAGSSARGISARGGSLRLRQDADFGPILFRSAQLSLLDDDLPGPVSPGLAPEDG